MAMGMGSLARVVLCAGVFWGASGCNHGVPEGHPLEHQVQTFRIERTEARVTDVVIAPAREHARSLVSAVELRDARTPRPVLCVTPKPGVRVSWRSVSQGFAERTRVRVGHAVKDPPRDKEDDIRTFSDGDMRCATLPKLNLRKHEKREQGYRRVLLLTTRDAKVPEAQPTDMGHTARQKAIYKAWQAHIGKVPHDDASLAAALEHVSNAAAPDTTPPAIEPHSSKTEGDWVMRWVDAVAPEDGPYGPLRTPVFVLTRAPAKPRPTVLVLPGHGQDVNNGRSLAWLRELADAGYTVVMPELRGQGLQRGNANGHDHGDSLQAMGISPLGPFATAWLHALAVLESQTDVVKRGPIAISGWSFGGTSALWLTAGRSLWTKRPIAGMASITGVYPETMRLSNGSTDAEQNIHGMSLWGGHDTLAVLSAPVPMLLVVGKKDGEFRTADHHAFAKVARKHPAHPNREVKVRERDGGHDMAPHKRSVVLDAIKRWLPAKPLPKTQKGPPMPKRDGRKVRARDFALEDIPARFAERHNHAPVPWPSVPVLKQPPVAVRAPSTVHVHRLPGRDGPDIALRVFEPSAARGVETADGPTVLVFDDAGDGSVLAPALAACGVRAAEVYPMSYGHHQRWVDRLRMRTGRAFVAQGSTLMDHVVADVTTAARALALPPRAGAGAKSAPGKTTAPAVVFAAVGPAAALVADGALQSADALSEAYVSHRAPSLFALSTMPRQKSIPIAMGFELAWRPEVPREDARLVVLGRVPSRPRAPQGPAVPVMQKRRDGERALLRALLKTRAPGCVEHLAPSALAPVSTPRGSDAAKKERPKHDKRAPKGKKDSAKPGKRAPKGKKDSTKPGKRARQVKTDKRGQAAR